MNKSDRIGIFDSGIGGITVLKEIIKYCQMKTIFIIAILKTIHMEIKLRMK